ncbi:MAG: bifunctional methylenetetrahydrofolate dehydrogenase/methenyltetrahydrofolate cyclohydrolase FolD [Chitinophagales bacterium]|nr:bifunctional methylenetetrahydrofolate dehydrogenase/methenyltetrahydrofolate cyclohydrolase FolD [Chitinophagales bacterium]MCZ2394683.1 bifunctional methylenetetrahydrofolate dehydrogenase/methenyltetrahydrofolate cyclohydrolase FolD [Chitinophagales bacterium]
MQVLDGKLLSLTIKQEIAQKVNEIKLNDGKTPHLAAILVGNDGASETYVASKVKSCQEVGFKSTLVRLGADVTEQELLAQINMLNNDDDIDGFIVQLPLPRHIDEQKIVQAISPDKDVDGFHPVNVGKMVQNLPSFLPATPFGILTLLKRNHIDTNGKHCVVIGRSNIVGMPMSILMARKDNPGNCTVTLCHSATVNLKEEILRADIIIAALGKPEFVTADMVKEGAVVIDVGITRIKDESKKSGFSLKGDVKYDEVAKKASFITPVPGGVGPMTVVSLMLNTLKAAENKKIVQ